MLKKEYNPPKNKVDKDLAMKLQQPIGNDGRTNPLFNKDNNPYKYSERNRDLKHLPKKYFSSRTEELRPQYRHLIDKKKK